RIDAVQDRIDLQVSEIELEKRKARWIPPPPKVTRGVLAKYVRHVTDASTGAVTDAVGHS
ncbi:MAG: dihydroxy-acid dehydratase, partial [Myxococcota bacterium]